MPKKSTRQPKPLYRQKPPKKSNGDFVHAEIIPSSHFELREDGTIAVEKRDAKHAPTLAFHDDARGLWLYHGNCLELLDAIAAKYPEGRFDAIFADPPYFLSNGGISCHAGKMVKVDKGDWDKSRGPELNHEFNLEWLKRCQKVLKPNGTIWITGTHHVIFSIGYAMQQLGFKILNDIAWEKPNPPPNLSCRYFTHSTETILWAAKNEKSKHVFNYQAMRKITGKQMKTVWREKEFGIEKEEMSLIWTLSAPGNAEKTFGKHPTQKPIALIERCLVASTNEGDMILDPFSGGGVEHNCSYSKRTKRRRHRARRSARPTCRSANPRRNQKAGRRVVLMNDAPWKAIADKYNLVKHDFSRGPFYFQADTL